MNDQTSPSVPLQMSIDYGGDHHDDDTVEHEVRFRVANAPKTQVIAIVQSNTYDNPRVIRYEGRGELGLPDYLLSQVTILCFGQLIRAMMSVDGNVAEVQVADGAEWMERRLTQEDSTAIIRAMSPHVDPTVTLQDFAWVRQD